MQRRHFVDTWYLIARADALDSHHRQANRLAALLKSTLVTHDAVLTELLAYFSAHGKQLRAKAVAVARNVIDEIELVQTSGRVFERALDFYERRLDKEYSLVDCMSMVVMRERGITHVLTNDHHFRQEGFTVLSDAP